MWKIAVTLHPCRWHEMYSYHKRIQYKYNCVWSHDTCDEWRMRTVGGREQNARFKGRCPVLPDQFRFVPHPKLLAIWIQNFATREDAKIWAGALTEIKEPGADHHRAPPLSHRRLCSWWLIWIWFRQSDDRKFAEDYGSPSIGGVDGFLDGREKTSGSLDTLQLRSWTLESCTRDHHSIPMWNQQRTALKECTRLSATIGSIDMHAFMIASQRIRVTNQTNKDTPRHRQALGPSPDFSQLRSSQPHTHRSV
jgi:hypothetical protein